MSYETPVFDPHDDDMMLGCTTQVIRTGFCGKISMSSTNAGIRLKLAAKATRSISGVVGVIIVGTHGEL